MLFRRPPAPPGARALHKARGGTCAENHHHRHHFSSSFEKSIILVKKNNISFLIIIEWLFNDYLKVFQLIPSIILPQQRSAETAATTVAPPQHFGGTITIASLSVPYAAAGCDVPRHCVSQLGARALSCSSSPPGAPRRQSTHTRMSRMRCNTPLFGGLCGRSRGRGRSRLWRRGRSSLWRRGRNSL